MGGKVDINSQRAKPAKSVQPGDVVCMTRGDFRLELEVKGLSERRVGAALAAELYTETAASQEARREAEERRRSRDDSGRPDKRARRALKALKSLR